MMNLKTTAMLGNLTRQGVSRQLMPLTNSKNSVLTLSQRTAAQGGNVSTNAPTNTVRSFSSSQTGRDSNANVTGAHQFQHSHPHTSPFSTTSTPTGLSLSSHQRFGPLAAANVNFRKDFSKTSASAVGNSNSNTSTNKSTISPQKYSQLSKDALDALNGQDSRAVFSYLQEMQHEGLYADTALSSRIVGQFLDQDRPKDAERALSILVDCHQSHGRTLTTAQKNVYTALAKDIASHSSDFTQALSLAKLLDRHGLLASSGFADGALRSYRDYKTNAGLEAVKKVIGSGDIETLLSLQSSLKTSNRYRHLIEILQDAKEMSIMPSQEICSRVSLSFMRLNDYTGQLAWDTAVQEIYPGFRASVPEDMESTMSTVGNSYSAFPASSSPSSSSSFIHTDNSSNNTSTRSSRHNSTSSTSSNSSVNDPSEAIIRACRFGYATVALEGINKMINQNQLPSAQAIADTIQVCAKREKERTTDYRQLFGLANQALEVITDVTQKRAAEYEVFNAMLVANATLGDMTNAKKNYDDIVRLGQFPDATGYATLLIATTTGAVDEAHDALRILEEVKRHKIKPNIFFYNVVIGKLSRGRKIERVLEVYEEMVQHKIRPNAITYGTLISACTRVGSEEMAKNLFQEMVSVPNYHARHGPHNAMIQFYVRQKKDRTSALYYYEDMLQRRLVPTEHTYTLLVEAFASILPYDLAEANRLIQSLKRGPVRATEAHYGALIHAYGVVHRDVSTAETVFNNMCASGVNPKGPAYQSLIESFITDNQVSRAVAVRNDLLRSGQPSSAYIENTLIRGFGLIQDVQKAEEIFEGMVDPCAAPPATGSGKNNNKGMIVKEPSTYQSMVTAYIDNGMIEKAQDALARMKNQHYPDLVVKPVEEAIFAALSVAATANSNSNSNSKGHHHGNHHHHHHGHHHHSANRKDSSVGLDTRFEELRIGGN